MQRLDLPSVCLMSGDNFSHYNKGFFSILKIELFKVLISGHSILLFSPFSFSMTSQLLNSQTCVRTSSEMSNELNEDHP